MAYTSHSEMSNRQPVARRLLTVPEVVALTGWSRSFVYQLVTSGKLRAVRAGRTVRIDRADLDAFIEASKVGAAR